MKKITYSLTLLSLQAIYAHAGITASITDSDLTGASVAAGTSASFQIRNIGASAGAPDNYRLGGSNDANGFLTADFTASAVGGDITSFDNNLIGASTTVKGVGLTLGAGVSSFTLSTTFDRYLHGSRTASTTDVQPWLSSGLLAVAADFNYNLQITYSNIASIVTNGSDDTIANGTAMLGLPTAYQDISDYVVTYKTALGTVSPSPTAAIAGSGANQTIGINADMSGPGNWLGLNSVRPNPPGSFTGSSSDWNTLSDPGELTDGLISRIQQVSARTISFTFTAIDNGGIFETGTEFLTSLDGRQEVAIQEALAAEAVPEPSSTSLIGLGALALILRRRKDAR